MLPPPPAPRIPAVRPAFVLVLALVALPILVLFGAGMVTEDEIEGSKSLIMAAIYVLGAMVAPVVLWRRLRRRGAAASDALAAALGLAVGARPQSLGGGSPSVSPYSQTSFCWLRWDWCSPSSFGIAQAERAPHPARIILSQAAPSHLGIRNRRRTAPQRSKVRARPVSSRTIRSPRPFDSSARSRSRRIRGR